MTFFRLEIGDKRKYEKIGKIGLGSSGDVLLYDRFYNSKDNVYSEHQRYWNKYLFEKHEWVRSDKINVPAYKRGKSIIVDKIVGMV